MVTNNSLILDGEIFEWNSDNYTNSGIETSREDSSYISQSNVSDSDDKYEERLLILIDKHYGDSQVQVNMLDLQELHVNEHLCNETSNLRELPFAREERKDCRPCGCHKSRVAKCFFELEWEAHKSGDWAKWRFYKEINDLAQRTELNSEGVNKTDVVVVPPLSKSEILVPQSTDKFLSTIDTKSILV